VQGEISLSLDTFRVPLDDPERERERLELAGEFQLHQLSVAVKTPLLKTLVKTLGDMYGRKPSDVVRVARNTKVRFQVRSGRMYHEGLQIGFPDISPDLIVRSRGSVGLDKSLDLVLDVPPILVDRTAPVRFRITGTIGNPVVTEMK
jgi:hypothetical protein